MSITDELREWAKEHLSRSSILAIADRIDAEHERTVGFCKRLEDAAAKREDVEIFGVEYTALPLDADGEYIHVGDVLTDGEYTFRVDELAAFGDGSWSIRNEDGNAWAACDVTHHHAPTVEDVLTEFGIDWEHESDCEDRAALLKEYAKRLVLADGKDA